MLVDRISLTNKSTDPAHRLSRPIAGSVLGRQLTVEFIGTFILVLTVGLATSSKGAGDVLDTLWNNAKWVRGLTLTPDDEPGFWENYGYHNHGDPWLEQRYQGD